MMGKVVCSVFFLCTAVFLSVSCRSQVTITRELRNDGYHRNLVSNIDIYSTSETYPCSLLLVEYLPSNVYVDSDQLIRLAAKTGLVSFLNTSVNIEAIANSEKATPFKAFLYPLEQDGPKITRSVELPIHLRYQAASSGGGYKNVNIGQPSLFSRCAQDNSDPTAKKFDLPCSANDRSLCKWTKLDAAISPATLTASVPVGNTDLGLYVSIVSYILLYGATFLIAKTIYYKKY
ncbi:phosphatidylinositol-glycan biosynthesis class X protein-like [Diaphorina citri]|uniref:Phosphatidylinositol-glycan biosynthesis class X protein n=1 Tax=Diaphorina citri TaxID=121845 RepID=A0A3Q0JKE3_DIACI|nr:phosphatidylinositol-glycan biosynthesis class X protein-like [Diaphorina citri]